MGFVAVNRFWNFPLFVGNSKPKSSDSLEVNKMADGNKPDKKYIAGNLTATVWNNKAMKNGKEIAFKSVTLSRSYKDNNGEWQSSNSFGVGDLPKAMLVLAKAYEYLAIRNGEVDEENGVDQ